MLIFRSLLNLFHIDGFINEMLYWPKLPLLRGISKAICDLVLYIFLGGTNSSFTHNHEVPFQYWKTFLSTLCSSLSFVGSQFISSNTLAPIWCLELSFKQKQIHLFWVTCISFLILLLIQGYQECMHSQRLN